MTRDATVPPPTASLGFEPDSLRDKYRVERDKRLRDDGNAQYLEVKDALAHFADDPWVEPGATRAPVVDEAEVVVIGGGFGGLLTGAHLRKAGFEDIRVIEKGADFGGTWYWNRYPGAMCDVESYIYLPLLEDLGTLPSEKYARAPEILAHSQAIGRTFDLYRGALFQTEVTALRWDETSARWLVTTNRGDALRARFVCMAAGPLNRPKLPGIPGIESFRGHSFHTSRWDYAYTGGNSDGGLTGLAGKRVGIIGTGATAVQCVPHLGAWAEQLFVFQRTPSSVDVRANRATDPEWAQGLEPGWQRRRMENFNTLVSGGFQDEDLVADGWTDIIRKLFLRMRDVGGDGGHDVMRTLELADFEKMEQIRARVDSLVTDPATAAALKPWYRQFCKRPCFHDEYLDTFNRPNVTLIDTDGHGVERITEHGVVAGGIEVELDCLVFATGFEVGTSYARRAGYELTGRDGRTLTQHWAEGIRTLHGMQSRGFPNCFVLGPQQAGFAVNVPHLLDEQARHIAHILGAARDRGARTVEVSPEAEAEWVATIISLAGMTQQFLEDCTPGYYNNEGKPGERRNQDGFYGAGPVAYFNLLEAWRAEGSLRGLELR